MAKKLSLMDQYAKAYLAEQEAKAFMKANKDEVVKILKQTNDVAVTQFGTLHHTVKNGPRELSNSILDKVSPELARKLVKAQIGEATKLIKAKELDQKLFDQFVTQGADVDQVTVS
jgi:predicted polyphosphate/ATP-dependent NAD kinase